MKVILFLLLIGVAIVAYKTDGEFRSELTNGLYTTAAVGFFTLLLTGVAKWWAKKGTIEEFKE